MTWLTGLIAFILIWWLVLFTVLPWGIRHDLSAKPEERSPGAPVNPGLGRKFLITTLIAAAVWIGVYVLIRLDVVDFRLLSMQMIKEDNVR